MNPLAKDGSAVETIFMLVTNVKPAVLSRMFFGLWALLSLYGFTKLALPGAWVPVAVYGCAALAIVFAPVPIAVRIFAAAALGVVARLLVWYFCVRPFPLVNDQHAYWELAQNLLNGKGLTTDIPIYGSGLRAIYPPVYPIVLALGQAIKLHYTFTNVLIDAAASFVLFKLAGIRAATAYFLFPATVLFAAAPSKEGLAIALLLCAMLAIDGRAWVFGVLSGLIALTQPAWAPLPAVAFILARKNWREVVAAAGAALSILAPWWVRNAIVLGHFVPLTSGAGLAFAVAVNKGHVATTGSQLDEVGRSAHAAANAMVEIAARPTRYINYVVKVAITDFLTETDSFLPLHDAGARWLDAGRWLAQAALTGLIGATAFRFRYDQRWTTFVLAFIVTCGIDMWFEFGTRHRAFLIPLLLMSAFGEFESRARALPWSFRRTGRIALGAARRRG